MRNDEHKSRDKSTTDVRQPASQRNKLASIVVVMSHAHVKRVHFLMIVELQTCTHTATLQLGRTVADGADADAADADAVAAAPLELSHNMLRRVARHACAYNKVHMHKQTNMHNIILNTNTACRIRVELMCSRTRAPPANDVWTYFACLFIMRDVLAVVTAG